MDKVFSFGLTDALDLAHIRLSALENAESMYATGKHIPWEKEGVKR